MTLTLIPFLSFILTSQQLLGALILLCALISCLPFLKVWSGSDYGKNKKNIGHHYGHHFNNDDF